MHRLVPLLLPLACASETQIQSQWDDWVDDHQTCETADDCTAVYPGCPLGCYEAVSTEHAAEAEQTADRLIRRYERAGRSCAYDCIETPPLTCESGRCGFDE